MKCKLIFAVSVLCIGCIETSFASELTDQLGPLVRFVSAKAVRTGEPTLFELRAAGKREEVRKKLAERPRVYYPQSVAILNSWLCDDRETDGESDGPSDAQTANSVSDAAADSAGSASDEEGGPGNGPVGGGAFLTETALNALQHTYVAAGAAGLRSGLPAPCWFTCKTYGRDYHHELGALLNELLAWIFKQCKEGTLALGQCLYVLDFYSAALCGPATRTSLNATAEQCVERFLALLRTLLVGTPTGWKPIMNCKDKSTPLVRRISDSEHLACDHPADFWNFMKNPTTGFTHMREIANIVQGCPATFSIGEEQPGVSASK